MRRNLVVGNWKMHGDIKANPILLQGIIEGLKNYNNADYVICPPNPYLFQARELLAHTNIGVEPMLPSSSSLCSSFLAAPSF